MPVRVDPLASLLSCPIDITVGDKFYEIPSQSAIGWLAVLLEELGSFYSVIELLPIKAKAEVEQDIIDGTVDPKDVEQAFKDAVEVAAGRPWWVVVNYLSLASPYWARFHGRVLASGLDIEKVSLGAYLDVLHYCMIEGRDDQTIQKVVNFLETPPPGFAIELDEETEGQTFLAMLNQ